ncbi:MAG: hypothetical protein ACU85E_07830 [Gammaproteobacteria bacterium]
MTVHTLPRPRYELFLVRMPKMPALRGAQEFTVVYSRQTANME